VGGGRSGVEPPSFDAADGRPLHNSTKSASTKLAYPPRYGVTVVSTPPPTVRLYVSDIPDKDDKPDAATAAAAAAGVNSVAVPSPSSDPISSGGDAPAGSGSVEPVDNCVNPAQRRCSQPNDRKWSDSGNVTTASGGSRPPADATTTVADVTWLADHQGRTGPLPFPPTSIAFAVDDESDGAAGGAIDSCDDSFHQSQETVVMRDAAAAARKAAAAARRKSVYYNATPEPTTATSASSDADLVTLPRVKHRHHHHHHHQRQRHREPEVETMTSLDRAGRPHASRTESADAVGSGRRRKQGVSDVDVTGPEIAKPEVTSSLDVGSRQPQRSDAACRVTRSTVHSEPRVARADSAAATVRFRSTDTLRPNPGPTGGAGAPGPGGAAAAAAAAKPTSTTRTYGPASVTVTPLTTVEPECARFPVSLGVGSAAGARTRPLDAAALLRSEYEASFGGDVNPLVLYSSAGGGGAGEQEVSISKQTVYDNIQYFNM